MATVNLDQILFDLSLEIKKFICIRFIDNVQCSKFISNLNRYNKDKITYSELGNGILIVRLAKNDNGMTIHDGRVDYLYVRDNEFIRAR